jgi:serine/threonine-protein kinase
VSEREPTILQPVPGSRRPDTPWSGYGLPEDLLAGARRRLALFVAFIGSMLVITTLVVLVAPVEWPDFDRSFTIVSVAIQVGSPILHAILWALIRSPRVSHTVALNLGLAYEVGLVLLIGTATHFMNATQGVDYDDRVFAVLIIALYPIIVPSPPRRAFFSSLAAAAMLPMGIVVLLPFGIPAQGDQYLTSGVLAFVSLAIAVLGSRVIYRMNVDVAHARRLGSYELETRLGQGGMGEVWRARHRLLARPAAIKLVRREMLGGSAAEAETALRRFEREARATAALRSPHTIDIYDYGISSDGVFYYVMELLDGLDLETLVSRYGPAPAARVVHLLRQACDSLAEAHDVGLIHRDVKPANLYVCRYGRETDFVKVLDFGLVTGDGRAPVPSEGLTMEGVVTGTPAFMAPEQILGNRSVDARTDLYALGCVGYELLTGARVFEGATPMETMLKHAREDPVAPSHRCELPIPEELDRLVLACLAKDPARRPQTADELADRLEACGLASSWTAEDARDWWRTHLPHPEDPSSSV